MYLVKIHVAVTGRQAQPAAAGVFFNMEEKEVSSATIGELVMKKLQEVDEVAYVRFASVYREFKDVNTFMEEIGKLLKK